MRLDHRRRATLEGDRLDDIRIQGALGEEGEVAQSFGFFLENFDEGIANGFSFLFRVGDAFKFSQEFVGSIDDIEVDAEVVAKRAFHFIFFAGPQKSVVDEQAVQVVADGFVNQHRRNRRIDAATQSANYF